jgi:putative addiction module killer protein
VKTIRRTDEFNDWLANLRDRKSAGRISVGVDKLAFDLGDIEPVGEGVSELRLHFGPGYRVYFVTRDLTLIIVLCGGDKSSQPTDIKEAKDMAKRLE